MDLHANVSAVDIIITEDWRTSTHSYEFKSKQKEVGIGQNVVAYD